MKESTIQLQRKTLNFVPGEILTRGDVAGSYDYPRNAVEKLLFRIFRRNIIWFRMEYNIPECHRITPGALKWKGDIFFWTKEIDVEKHSEIRLKMARDISCFLFPRRRTATGGSGIRHVYTMQLAAVRKEDPDYDEIAQNEYLYACVLNTTANGLKLEFNTSDCLSGNMCRQ